MAIQLVRHGGYNREGLTEAGKLQSVSARELLLAKGLGKNATILSSSALRAIQTAEIIAQVIGNGTVLPSDIIHEAGENPEIVRDLDTVIQASLSEHGIDSVDNNLVIVAHMPLLAMIEHGDRYEEVENGGVVDYIPGTWINPDYHPNYFLTQPFEEKFGLQQVQS